MARQKSKSRTTQIGRDAKTGRFIPVDKARKRPATTIVHTIKRKR